MTPPRAATRTGGRRRVLVTGSRTWTDTATIRDALAGQWGDGTAVLVTGACPRGADRFAEQCWTAWGGRVERHPADWDRHGRSAGYRRNAAMVNRGADVCLAFVHGEARGTRHAADLAARAGIPTHRYDHGGGHRRVHGAGVDGTRGDSASPVAVDPDRPTHAAEDDRHRDQPVAARDAPDPLEGADGRTPARDPRADTDHWWAIGRARAPQPSGAADDHADSPAAGAGLDDADLADPSYADAGRAHPGLDDPGLDDGGFDDRAEGLW